MNNANQPTLLVTGGSRGIGAAIARLAVNRGYRVAINYRSNHLAADKLVEELSSLDGEVFAIQADIANEMDVKKLFSACDKHWGNLTVLVNNAGIVDQSIRFEDTDRQRIDRLFAVNVTGTMLCAREAIKRQSKRFGGIGGSIINISSIAALYGSPNEYVDYAASKGALDTFTIGLAREVANDGIRVNGVRPGIIDTEIHASGGELDRASRLASTIPMSRPGTAIEVANAVLWLASDEASYITGSLLNVSGGR
ncbi:MAG: glucose 1-dehydrogenase [Granulosicoccus sp.]